MQRMRTGSSVHVMSAGGRCDVQILSSRSLIQAIPWTCATSAFAPFVQRCQSTVHAAFQHHTTASAQFRSAPHNTFPHFDWQRCHPLKNAANADSKGNSSA